MIPLNTIRCCDCLNGMREIPDKSIDLVITDPPYGIGFDGKTTTDHNGWQKYERKEWDNHSPTKEYFDEIFRISKNQIIWGGNYFTDKLLISRCWIVWYKVPYEFSLSQAELAWTSFNTGTTVFERMTNMDRGFMNKDGKQIHPTQKPVKLFEWIIKNYAKEGDTICDPFFGSGSCLVAAVRMGHQFIGFEKEQSYFDKAQIRIKKAQEQGKITGWFE